MASSTFQFTGGAQNFVVPAGVTEVVADCYGAQGGATPQRPSEGQGGYARSRFAVTPGETLTVFVGGQGNYGTDNHRGYNGGGSGRGDGGGNGGGSGGGATDVRRGGTALSNRRCVAAGGGGSNVFSAAGGAGGGLNGDGGNGGGGASQTAGGSGVGGAFPEAGGLRGGDGSLGQGGNGVTSYGGGGGGGFYGGGGGGYNAANSGGTAQGVYFSGGGGSSYVEGVGATTTTGGRLGNGLAILTYNLPPNTPTSLAPSGNTGINTVTLSAVVSDPEGENAYAEFRVSGGHLGAQVTIAGTTVASGGTSTATFNGVANNTYSLNARAIDSSGAASAIGGAVSFTTNRPPTAPAVTAPNGGETVNTLATVSWSAGSDPDGQAVTYDVDLTTDGGGSWSNLKTAFSGTSFTHDFTNVPASTACRVRVRTRDTQGAVSAYDESNANFTVEHNRAPTAPLLGNPANGSTQDLGAGFTFTYTATDPDGIAGDPATAWAFRRKVTGAATYEHWNAGTGAFQTALVWNTNPTGSVAFASGKWTNGNTYNWSVATKDTQGTEGPFAADFAVTASSVATTTVTAPTGTVTGTSRPLVRWTLTQPEGLPQQTYQVRVFTVAQATAGGFDPATSVAVWDTPEVTSAGAREHQVGVDLLNSGSYRAYVRLKAGNLFTGWAFSAFSLSLVAPRAPGLVVTDEPVSPFGPRVRLDVTTDPGLNLLTANQASLETDTTGWTGGNAFIARSTAQSFDGTASLAVTTQSAGNSAAFTSEGAAGVPVVAGQVYTGVAMARAGTTGRAFLVRLYWYNSAGSLLSNNLGADYADNTAGWSQARFTMQAPAGAAFAAVEVLFRSTAAGEVHYVDAVGLFTDPTGNLVPNPDFENGLAGWGQQDNTLLTHDTTQSYTGRGSAKVTATAAGVTPGFGLSPLASPGVKVQFGGTYTLSAWVRSSVTADFNIGPGNIAFGTNYTVQANTWTRLVHTFTVGSSGATETWPSVVPTGTAFPSGATLHYDAVQVVVGSSPVEYLPPTTHNLVTGPSSELGGVFGNLNNATVTPASTEQAFVGTTSAKVVSVAGGEFAAFVDDGAILGIVAGGTYTASIYARASTTARNFYLRAVFFNDAGGVMGSTVSGLRTLDNGWQRHALTALAPAGSTRLRLDVFWETSAAGEVHYLDAVQVEQGSVATPYVDGSLGAGHRWDASENLITNPSFETDTAGWQGLNRNLLTANQSSLETDTTGWSGDGATLTRSTAQAFDGTASMQMAAVTGSGYAGALQQPGTIPVVAGQVYTAVAHFRAATVAREVSVQIDWYNSANQNIGTVSPRGLFENNSAGWKQARTTAQAPANAVSARLYLVVWAPANNEVHYVDAVGLFETPNANLMPDPDLERPGSLSATSDASKWSQNLHAISGGTRSISTEDAYTGRTSMKLVTSAGGDGTERNLGASIRLQLGTTYTFSCRIKIVSGGSLSVGVAIPGNAAYPGAGNVEPGTGWQHVVRTFTPTNLDAVAYIGANSSTPGVYFVDAVQVVVGSSPVEYLPPTTHNLVLNSSFEADPGWLVRVGGSGGQGYSTSRSFTGSRSFFAQSGTGQAISVRAVTPFYDGATAFEGRVNCTPGQTITLSAYMNSVSGFAGQWRMVAEHLGGSAETFGPTVTVPADQWTRVAMTFVVPAGVTGFVPRFDAVTVSAQAYVDAVQVEAGSVATPYVDGSLGAGYRWDASESPIQNPAGAVDTSGWQSNTSNTPFTISRVTGVSGPPVSTAIRAAVGANANSYQFVQGVGATYPTGHSFFVAGQTYTVSFWARSISGGTSFSVDFKNGPSLNNPGLGASFLLTTSWQRFVFTGVAVANGAADSHFTFNTNGGTDYTFEFTAVQVEQRPYATAYAAPGTAHASTSTRQTPWVLGGTSLEVLLRVAGGASGGFRLEARAATGDFPWHLPGYEFGFETAVAVAPSTTYTLSGYVQGSPITARVVDQLGNRLAVVPSLPNGAISPGTRHIYTFTTGASSTSVRVQYFYPGGFISVPIANTFYLDAVQLEQRPYATAFGATGTPHASTSTRQTRWEPGGFTQGLTYLVERSEDGGTVWTAVRDGERLPVDVQQRAVLYDYEPPRAVPVQYRAATVVDL